MWITNFAILFLFYASIYSKEPNKFIKLTWKICPSNLTVNTTQHASLLKIQDTKSNQSMSLSIDMYKKLFIIDLNCENSDSLYISFTKKNGNLYLRRKITQNIIEVSTEGSSVVFSSKNGTCLAGGYLNETIYKLPSNDNEFCFEVNYIPTPNQNDGFKLKKLNNSVKCSECASNAVSKNLAISNQNPCSGVSCLNGGRCILDPKNHTASCACNKGFSGDKCQNKKQCSGTNTTDSACDTDPFETSLTRFKRSVSLATTVTTLCKPNNPCKNNGKCTLSGNTYKCTCAAGLTGTNCEIISCANGNPCVFATSCNTNQCNCITGFGGALCDTLTDTCTTCLNSAKCFKMYNNFICLDSLTNPKFSGQTAATILTECTPSPCVIQPKTRCLAFVKETVQSNSCNCIFGRTGSDCSKETTFTINPTGAFIHTPSNSVAKIVYKMRLKSYGPDGYIFTLKFKEDSSLFMGVEINEGGIKVSTATESKMMTSINSVGTSKTEFIPTEYHLEIKTISGINILCLYVRVQTLSNGLQGGDMCVKYPSGTMIPTFVLGKPNSFFSDPANSVLKQRFLMSELINCCFQDFSINDVYTPTPSVTPNCLVKTSCSTTSCGLDKGRAEKCVEYLSSKKCVCKRPFTGPECGVGPGNNLINVKSNGYMQFQYSTELLASLNEKIEVSLFLQTITTDAVLFYFGNYEVSSTDVQGFAAELVGGYVSVNSKIKAQATKTLLFNENLSWKINDKQLRLLTISLIDDKVTLKIDVYNSDFTKIRLSLSQTKSLTTFMPNYVSSLADNLRIVFFGQIPSSSAALAAPVFSVDSALIPPKTIPTLPSSLITKPGSIIGQFKDLEINSYKMATDNLKSIEVMPPILTFNNCPENTCQNGGLCVINIYFIETCQCLANNHGDKCEFTNKCVTDNPCTPTTSCVPFENSAICKGPFSIIQEKTLIELAVKNPSVSFTEVRMKLKTRSINTVVFEFKGQLSGGSTNVKATLLINNAGKLEGGVINTGSNSNLGSKVVSTQVITDAKPHDIVFKFSPGISIEIDSTINRASDYGKPEIAAFTVPASAASLSTILIGNSANSFLGCFDEFLINNYPIGTVGSLAKDSTIFNLKNGNVVMECSGKNFCSPDPCKNGAPCADQFNKFACSCNADYEGTTCEVPKCSKITCAASNIVSGCAKICPSDKQECNLPNTLYGCTCSKFWIGPQCDIRNPCLTAATGSNVCLNQATCKYTLTSSSSVSHVCNCTTGYTGTICNIPTFTSIITTTTTVPPPAISSAGIAGIIVGVVIGLLLIGLLVWACMVYKSKRSQSSSYENQDDDSTGYDNHAGR